MIQSRWTARVRKSLAIGLLPALLLGGATAALAQSVSFQGQTFVNKGLVGVGRVPSNATDKYGDTTSIGSGMAVLPGSWKKRANGTYHGRFLMLPDRGWNTAGTVDYAGRLQRFEVEFKPYYGTGSAPQNQIALTYKTSNLFHEPKKNTTGLDPLGVRPATATLPPLPLATQNGRIPVDDEGIVYPGDGTMWVSDEYGPYVYHYTASGKLLNVIRPPEAFVPKRLNANGIPVDDFSANAPPQGGPTYNKGNPVSGRQNNQGAEGLAISPDHTKLYILLQSALIQDLNATSAATIRTSRRNARMLTYDITGATPKLLAEYVVQLPLYAAAPGQPVNLTAAQSELLALNDHQFLVIARDSGAGHGLAVAESVYRSVDLIDTDGATNLLDVPGIDYNLPTTSVAPNGALNPAITPVAYQQFLNINDSAQLAKFGLHNGTPNDDNNLVEKWEALAVLPVSDKQNPNDYFLVVASDNDFITQNGSMQGNAYSDASGINNDSLVFIYRVTLPTYQAH